MTTSNDKEGTIFKSPENKWVLIWGGGGRRIGTERTYAFILYKSALLDFFK